jgi:hypothetical protein
MVVDRAVAIPVLYAVYAVSMPLFISVPYSHQALLPLIISLKPLPRRIDIAGSRHCTRVVFPIPFCKSRLRNQPRPNFP